MARGARSTRSTTATSAATRGANGRPARRRGDSHLRAKPLAVARDRDSRCGGQCARVAGSGIGADRRRRRGLPPGHGQLRRRVLDRDRRVAPQPTLARGLRDRCPRLRSVPVPRGTLHPPRAALAVSLRARRSGRAGGGSRSPCGARAWSQVGACGLRPCARRPRDARAGRLPHPGIPLLRPARVRREHEDRCGDASLDRGVATRASRSGAPVRRPGSSVTLARRATRGARCRRT